MRAMEEKDIPGFAERLVHYAHAIRADLLGSLMTGVSEQGEPISLYLWVNQKRTCWFFKALHEYEAWVTAGAAPDSPRYDVDELAIHISRQVDGANYWHTGQHVSYWAKSDEIWHTGGACGRTACFAKATMWGKSWTTGESDFG